LDHQNNCTENLSVSNAAKNFNILAIYLGVLYYFDSLTKSFLDLHLAKYLNTLAKLFFPYNNSVELKNSES